MSVFFTGSAANPLLQRLVEWEESDEDVGVACYFEKVMRLFEQVPAPQYVIRIAESAVTLIEEGHPRSVSYVPFLGGLDGANSQIEYCVFSFR